MNFIIFLFQKIKARLEKRGALTLNLFEHNY
jgi:hypothetical protein